MLLDRKLMVLFGAALIVIAGCGDDAGGGGKKKGGGGSGGAGGTEPVPPISAKANVKFKTKDRLLKDIGNALSLDANEICKEVGAFDCSVVHSIALGGVDAYGAGVYEPLKSSAVTTPVAVDRLVLGACQMRAHLDFKDMGNAVIYKGLDLQGGKLANVEDAAVAAAITTLYRRIHLRDPKDGEVTHLKELYNDVDAAGSAQPALDWATLGCYAVGTMMESVFY